MMILKVDDKPNHWIIIQSNDTWRLRNGVFQQECWRCENLEKGWIDFTFTDHEEEEKKPQ